MIEFRKVNELSKKIGVSEHVILMEAYQVLVLNELSEISLSKRIIFKGGTCLRLIYGSFRFSEDLDFSMLKKISFTEFKKAIVKIVSSYPELKLSEIFDMKNTLFARIVAAVGKNRVGIKIEISKRSEKLLRDKDYKVEVINSEVNLMKPLLKVATLEKIYKDKLATTKTRRKPRDWFDLWFVGKLLGKKWDMKVNVPRKLMEDRVRFLLPKQKRSILDEFIYEDN